MSKAKVVTSVELTVSPETAEVIRQLVYMLNWSQFPDAEGIVDVIDGLGLDGEDVRIEYNESTGEFVRS